MSKARVSLRPSMQGYVLLAPALIVYLLFAVYPMIDVVRMSFSSWNGLSPQAKFVGLANYRAIMTQDPVFWGALWNTLIWTATAVIVPNLIAFGVALALNQNIPGKSGLRIIFYLPVIIAAIAVATIWKWMYDPFFGLFNGLLTSWGLTGWIMDWLGDKKIALWSVFVAHVWQSVGFSMVLFLAGLQSVSTTLIEAARIDGAGRWGVFRYVTLPALVPTITVVFVLSLINSLKAFDIVYGMTGGGPAQSTQMLAMWAYTQSMQLGVFGRGAAISVVLLMITLIVVIPYMHWMFKREDIGR
ncbi:sugar ABC transporter permease [Rhizobium lentis]|uniref:carbohydrate ABC transporter permease n=1 Tax=Rhizobium TaxID=379 RepID=UPI001C835D17|nr:MULTISPECIES: sugar ABC transporter permease [Rhizobium]MBX5132373.1 sugar ABC transporter permease [Rhizobium lentis]MBX5213662.1 sugar ABC transporter permease [Rhizobium sp. NLR9a]MBX5219183.1 sugar ABC transporter permease [Rhizobium sp. NLR8a]MBX5275052.1 sugar ABC transporter permease [Rhizobium sp. NLR13a]MBX5281251.1 sugar ABC transporter permease [Rhizobium sp. NLR10a]